MTAADFSDLMFTSVYETKGLGVTHVNINQRYRDMEVFGGQITVNVGADGKVVFAGGQAVSLATVASDAQNLDATAAVNKAALGLKLQAPQKVRVLRRTGAKSQTTVLSGGGISRTPIEATLGWQPSADGLRLAWRTIIDESDDAHLWNAAVDAKTGALLKKDDWTSHDNLDELKGRLQRSKARQLAPAFRSAVPWSARPSRCSTARPTASTRGRTRARSTPPGRWSPTRRTRSRRRSAGMTSTARPARTS